MGASKRTTRRSSEQLEDIKKDIQEADHLFDDLEILIQNGNIKEYYRLSIERMKEIIRSMENEVRTSVSMEEGKKKAMLKEIEIKKSEIEKYEKMVKENIDGI